MPEMPVTSRRIQVWDMIVEKIRNLLLWTVKCHFRWCKFSYNSGGLPRDAPCCTSVSNTTIAGEPERRANGDCWSLQSLRSILEKWRWSEVSIQRNYHLLVIPIQRPRMGLFMSGGYDGEKALGDLYSFDTKTCMWMKKKTAGRAPSPRGCPVKQHFEEVALLDMCLGLWKYVALNSVDSKATIGVEFQTRTLVIQHKNLKAQIWDTAAKKGCFLHGSDECDLESQRAVPTEDAKEFTQKEELFFLETSALEGYRAVTSACYRAAGAVLVYDIAKRQSFDLIRRCLEELRGHADKNIVVPGPAQKRKKGRNSTLKHQNIELKKQLEANADECNEVKKQLEEFKNGETDEPNTIVYKRRSKLSKCGKERADKEIERLKTKCLELEVQADLMKMGCTQLKEKIQCLEEENNKMEFDLNLIRFLVSG
ncbi:hypothetical protein C5167_048239 [Papaver somniferum]|uniref:Uncharacterized protein n=1 Tax=Papaver somniferum TaxID=3469 RepID=A0A4Y7KKA5_PAPSO|nr:hypothetical protein C5167_048239 [Papaver somniferum]